MLSDASLSDDSRRALRRVHVLSSSKTNSNKNNKRKTTCLPQETVDYLKAWMMSPAHVAHPYPTEQEKLEIMADTGIELKQLTNWFVNNRKRFWKPQVEAKFRKPLVQEEQEATTTLASAVAVAAKNPPSSSSFFATKRTVSQVSLLAEDEPRRPSIVSPMRGGTVSETSDSGMTSDDDDESLTSSSDEEDVVGTSTTTSRSSCRKTTTKSNMITMYILRPDLGETLTMEHVVTDCEEEAARDHQGVVLEQYECVMSYTCPGRATADEREALYQAEVQRLKEQYLHEYLERTAALETTVVEQKKRSRSLDALEHDALDTPRLKYRRVSIELWKEVCQSARDGYDLSLPSLEEAASLFGFAEPLGSSEV